MSRLETVRGAIDTAEMGTTLMHEHVFVLTVDVEANLPAPWDEEAQVAGAIEKLRAVADIGVRTIVDPTVIGLGRHIPRIQRINENVDINIVAATGVYTYDSVPFYFMHRGPALGPDVPDPMVELFVNDITNGIAGTAVKAALLKCAIDRQGLTPGVERVLRAVAAAHKETGTPIMVHTHPRSRQGLAAAGVLTDEAVDPHRVLLAHSGDTEDVEHLCELADAGYLLGMDRFGIDVAISAEQRAATVIELCRRGYVSNMVLSQDAACYIDWVDETISPIALPNWHFTHIHQHVLPALREGGVTEAQIDEMLVTNPRRFFEGS